MRTSRGLPFNACVHARVCTPFQGKPAHLSRNLDSTRGWPLPGRTYLTYRWEVKQGERTKGAHAKNVAMHLCVCLITLI